MEVPERALTCIVLLFLFCAASEAKENQDVPVTVTWETSLKLERNETKNLTFHVNPGSECTIDVYLTTVHVHSQSKNDTSPINFITPVSIGVNETDVEVPVYGMFVGQAILAVNNTTSSCNVSADTSQRIEIYVVHLTSLIIVIEVIGWIYFAAWSVSFYPQVILNFHRKSVVGLNFDYLAYNITGFVAYGIYNIGLFWIPLIQDLYLKGHPDGVNPVQINDVVFTLHAIVVTAFTIFQCFIFERGGQKLSKVAILLLSVAWTGMLVLLFVAVAGKITWLTYLYVFSYVKLGVTLIKYIPQALMNYRRKSTEGWSIGNVLLDFTGGSFSILQMIMQSYNNDEWDLVFGDPTKFGLGAFSVMFDILFMVQHYILYRPKKGDLEEPLINTESET